MKLDNHGWGMRDMIIYTCILLLFLLFVAYSVNALYDSMENTGNNNQQNVDNKVEEKEPEVQQPALDLQYYREKEYQFYSSTMKYVKDQNVDLSKEILKIDLKTLVDSSYMSPVYDQTGSEVCTGYSNVYQDNDGDYIVKSYINCNNYTTEGF